MDVGDFFQFERALERDGVMDAAAQVEEVGVPEELAAQPLINAGLVSLQDSFHLVGHARQLLQ